MTKKIAIVAHGHPEHRAGGAELAAYTLFEALKERDDVKPFFVARCDPSILGHDGWFAKFRNTDDEILWSPPQMDFFRLISMDSENLISPAKKLLDFLQPDVLHVQHYAHIGLDFVQLAADELNIPTVMTLHEYLMICANKGHMQKTNGRLCYAESFADCPVCLERGKPGHFFARKEHIQSAISRVKKFISPSHFLKQRYVEWGLDASRISVIENMLPPYLESVDAVKAKGPKNLRSRFHVGFFGQISPEKGIHVLLEAAKLASKQKDCPFRISIHGANVSMQAAEFQEYFKNSCDELSGIVTHRGAYKNDQIVDLMRTVDCVVIPSVWWENAPVVIEEAKAAGVPVICSDIGGMAEKVKPGLDGLHFLAQSPVDLVRAMRQLMEHRDDMTITPTDVKAQNKVRSARHMEVYDDALD